MLTSHKNNAVSVFHFKTNAKGDSLLTALRIPNPFPAVIEHFDKDYKFYYFCGDFCNYNIQFSFSKFYGSDALFRFINETDESSRNKFFFWNYYYPLMNKILDSYYHAKIVRH